VSHVVQTIKVVYDEQQLIPLLLDSSSRKRPLGISNRPLLVVSLLFELVSLNLSMYPGVKTLLEAQGPISLKRWSSTNADDDDQRPTNKKGANPQPCQLGLGGGGGSGSARVWLD